MIQFFVNNHELVLPEDFSVTLIEENSIITNNGEFTLDMDISLLEPPNAIVFQHVNRLNVMKITKDYEAYSIVDGQVRFGKLLVLSNTDISIKCQFVAGNSELNYLAKDDKKIWELDWGTETEITYNLALRSTWHPGYGDKSHPVTFNGNTSYLNYFDNYVCAPLLIGGKIYNNFLLNENTLVVPNTIIGIERIIMQPYLLYYLNKLPSLLGFNAGDNALSSDERVKLTYLINAIDSLNYSDALPDMTIAEFITAIETTYNVWFIVNSINNTMSVVRTQTQLENKKTVRLLNVLDEFTREIVTDEKSFRFGYSKIEYELPDNQYFKYQALSEDILKKCTILNFQNISGIATYILANDNPDKFIIYRVTSTNEDYFYGRPALQDFCSIKIAENKYITLINKFKGVGESNENVISLKVIPAHIQGDYREVMWYRVAGQEQRSKFQYQLPVSSNQYQNVIVEQGFMKSVEDGIKTTKRLSVIEVALFSGTLQTSTYLWWVQVPTNGRLNIKYPFSHTDYWPDFWVMDNISDRFTRFQDWYYNSFYPFVTTTMRLSGTNGLVETYKLENLVDFEKKYQFTMPDSPDITVNNLFEYNGKNYMPISLEREISVNSRKIVTGKFYAMLQSH